MANVVSNQKTYTIWKLEWPEILEGEETYGLARELTRKLRAVDQREILAFTPDIGREVSESIDWSYELQYATTKNGDLIAVWGVQPKKGQGQKEKSEYALIWCLGTDLVKKYAFSFARESKFILQEWAKKYGMLFNTVGKFNTDAIHWLKWIGADFLEGDQGIIRNGEVFLPFVIRYSPEKQEGGK